MTHKKYLMISGAAVLAFGFLSCGDLLNLTPIDYYSGNSYWKNEAHVQSYVHTLHYDMRSVSGTHMLSFGELRGGGLRIDGYTVDLSSGDHGDLILNNLDEDATGVSNYADYYGKIVNVNLFIQRVSEATYLSEERKAYYLGVGYGLRAFYYFDLYRAFGWVVLREDAQVIDGNFDPVSLRKPQSSPKEVMAFIKKDLKASLDNFDASGGTTFSKGNLVNNSKAYWTKAATEYLKGEVYLWNSKVTIGDNPAVPGDIDEAKTAFSNVVNNYGLRLLPKFSDIFSTKDNAEQIFCIRYKEGESTNWLHTYCYNMTTGQARLYAYTEDGVSINEDPLKMIQGTVMRNEHKTGIYESYDRTDQRRNATFLGAYSLKEGATDPKNPENLELCGVFTRKNIGHVSSATGLRVTDGDYIYYRLAGAYLALAEIANFKGDNAGVRDNLNEVRKRAYADKWDESLYGFTPGDFRTNELAILAEKDKEMVQEGQRWYDINRMTISKGGEHLVFLPESYVKGIKQVKVGGKLRYEPDLPAPAPILDKTKERHKVLWPINKSQLQNDDSLVQTPGYKKKKDMS